MYGLATETDGGEQVRAKKPTGFMTSSWTIAEELSITCQGGHEQQHIVNDRAKYAAIYPEELCEAMRKGLMRQNGLGGSGVEDSPTMDEELMLQRGAGREGGEEGRRGYPGALG